MLKIVSKGTKEELDFVDTASLLMTDIGTIHEIRAKYHHKTIVVSCSHATNTHD